MVLVLGTDAHLRGTPDRLAESPRTRAVVLGELRERDHAASPGACTDALR